MALIPNETEQSLPEVISHFSSIIPTSPLVINVDQDAACITAIRSIFPSSLICLDEWHLNQNQLKNCQEWCNKIGRRMWAEEMINDIHALRKSCHIPVFETRRSTIEKKYFHNFNENAPKWFSFLYTYFPQMTVFGIRNEKVSRRFCSREAGTLSHVTQLISV